MIGLPARYYVVPVDAEFRPDPLPPELKSTWHLLRALSWTNDYRFTPPVSLTELLTFRFRLNQKQSRDKALMERLKRTLINHLNRLESAGWLRVERTPGQKNIYRPLVPPPARSGFAGTTTPALWAEGPSISALDAEDSAWLVDAATAEGSETDFTSPIVDVVVPQLAVPAAQKAERQQQQIALAPRTAAQDVLYRAGILPPTLDEFVAVELDVAEAWADWIADAQKNHTAKNPPGIAINALRADPNALPPRTSVGWTGRRKPLIQGPLVEALKRRQEKDVSPEEKR